MWKGQSPQTTFGPTQLNKYLKSTLLSSFPQGSVIVWMRHVLATELRGEIFTEMRWNVLWYQRGGKQGQKLQLGTICKWTIKGGVQPNNTMVIPLSPCTMEVCHTAANVRLHAGCRYIHFWQSDSSKVRHICSCYSCLRPHSICEHTTLQLCLRGDTVLFTADHRKHQAWVNFCWVFIFLFKDVCTLLVTTDQT